MRLPSQDHDQTMIQVRVGEHQADEVMNAIAEPKRRATHSSAE
jgi:hypothetical protein